MPKNADHNWRRREGGGMTRREFLKVSVATTAAAGAGDFAWAIDGKTDMPYRTLGRTGEKVSLIGLGGSHLGRPTEQESFRIIRTAIDSGINFMDNSWDYYNGLCEERMGKALRDGYRARVFLMTKFDGRTRQAAQNQIDESLRRLQVDHLDLLQIHEVGTMDDADRVFAPGGAIEALLESKKAGKTRYLGFTGHKNPGMHLKMLDTAAAHQFKFDAVQMPLNVMDPHFESFERRVLPFLLKQNTGVLAMKTMGFGRILDSKVVTATECLHYAMNLPTSVVITGCDSMSILQQALDAARNFRPMSKEQVAALLAKTADAAKNGRYESYKTSNAFDATHYNPKWLG
jgi:predicted aldo/keto reductase-like oxidoreductase